MRVDARVYIKAKRAGRATSVRVAPTGTAVEQYQVSLGNRHSLRPIGVVGLQAWSERSTQTETWVRVPRLSSLCPRRIVAFDGGRGNIDRCMEFGDEFGGSALSAAWATTLPAGSSVSVAGGNLTFSGPVTPNGTWARVNGVAEYAAVAGYALRQKARFLGRESGAGIDRGSVLGMRDVTSTDLIQIGYFAASTWFRASKAGTNTSVTTNADTTGSIYELKVLSSSVAATKDGTAMTGSPITSNVPTAAIPIMWETTGGAANGIECDWVAVRKYTANEPIAGTAQPTANNRALSRPMSHADLMRACCAA